MIRDRMPAIPNDFYHDKYMYGIRCDEPRFPQPMSTFAQCEQMIAEVADLTDHAPQIVHLWGWQFKGKDTGYPAVNVVDERIGGYDGMMQVMERGRALNATVSLSDNYDDAYKSSPAWNEDYIARRPDGQLWQSRAWTGEVSFIQGLAKYMEGPGVERVRYTCERYKLPQTTHIDVLSYYAIRNDWDPKHPASGIRNLRQGRYRVLEEFAKHGVDVTSEGLRYPMIGKISCCLVRTDIGDEPVRRQARSAAAAGVWQERDLGPERQRARRRVCDKIALPFLECGDARDPRSVDGPKADHGCVLSQLDSLDAFASEGTRELRAQR